MSLTKRAYDDSDPMPRLTPSLSLPSSMRVSSVEPPPMSIRVPRSMARSQVAPTNPRWASSRAESSVMGSPVSSSIAAMASSQLEALRSTAVAKQSMRLHWKYFERLRWPLSTLAARLTPASVKTPSSTYAARPAIDLLLMRWRKSL